LQVLLTLHDFGRHGFLIDDASLFLFLVYPGVYLLLALDVGSIEISETFLKLVQVHVSEDDHF
jgi:hypothetical protein